MPEDTPHTDNATDNGLRNKRRRYTSVLAVVLFAVLAVYLVFVAWPQTELHEAYLPQLRTMAAKGSAEANVAFGARLLDAHAYAEAADVFKTAIAKGQSSPEIYQALAASDGANGREDLCSADLNEGLSHFPGNTDLLKSLTAIKNIAPQTQLKDVVSVILPISTEDLFLQNAPGSILNGYASWIGRRHPKTIGSETAGAWYASEPNNPDASEAWITALLKNARPFDALPIIQSRLAIDPNSYRLLKYEGDAWDGLGNHQSAVSAYLKSLSLHPRWVPGLKALANISLRYGLARYSLTAFQQLSQIDPNNPDYWIGVGNSCITGTLQTKTAIDAYQRVSKLAPHRTDFYVPYAKALIENGKYSDAEALLRTRLSMESGDGQAYYLLGSVLILFEPSPAREAEALADTQAALRLLDNQPSVLEQLANIYIIEHRSNEAIPVLLKSLTIDPYSTNAMFLLSRAFAVAGRLDLSQKLSKQIQVLHSDSEQLAVISNQSMEYPTNPVLHHKLADLYYRVGKIADAQQESRLEVLMRKDPKGTMKLIAESKAQTARALPGQ